MFFGLFFKLAFICVELLALLELCLPFLDYFRGYTLVCSWVVLILLLFSNKSVTTSDS